MQRTVEDKCSSIFHECILFIKIDGYSDNFKEKLCRISENKLTSININTNEEKTISLKLLSSIQIVDESKRIGEKNLFCFKVKFSISNNFYLFGTSSTTKRLQWIQKFLGSVSDEFSFEIIPKFKKAGFVTSKDGINGEWQQDWLLLNDRELTFVKQTCGLEPVDLRKVRAVVIQKDEDLKSSVLVIDCITKSIHLTFDAASEMLDWHHLIQTKTVIVSSHLKDQQLNVDQVPVIVEKCINFIFAHGYMSEGIYRRNGSCVNATKLLSAFSKDAWAVQLSLQEFSVNDVASVLKKFLKNLSESVFTTELYLQFCDVAKSNSSEDEKVVHYKSILKRLPDVNYATLRRLMNHLYYIQLQSDTNLMNAQNLSAIWGQTLIYTECSTSSTYWSNIKSKVVNDLILLYPKLFDETNDEKLREQQYLEAINAFNLSCGNVPQRSKPSGDLLFWVYIGSKYCENCVSVTLNPTKTALMICDELASKIGVRSGCSLGLQEVMSNGTLFRPIHHSEFVLNVVLLWGYWDKKYRKDNYIVCLFPNSLLSKIMSIAKETLTIRGKFKFADLKSKSYKSHLFEISEDKLICYKDKSESDVLNEWLVKDIIWYIGYEPNRNSHTRLCISFISKYGNHSEELNDYFGWSIAVDTVDDHLRWMATLLSTVYGYDQIAPPVTMN